MSGGEACKCKVRGTAEDRERFWRVVQYRCNRSAFNGYHKTRSEYSGVRCLFCGAYWRTRAAYVYRLLPATGDEATRVVERG